MRTNPVFRGAPKYLRFLITTGSSVLPGFRCSTITPALPPLSRASARSLVALHSTGASWPNVKDFHFTGYTLGTIVVMASRWAFVVEGSKVISAHSVLFE